MPTKNKTKPNKSGGAASTGGTNFQQRVAALALAHLLANFKNFKSFGLDGDHELLEVRHETNDHVDDFVLIFSQHRSFVQAKRSIDFSEKTSSEFSKVIEQFIRQYISNWHEGDCYILATSHLASRKITEELKKLTISARLNASFAKQDPLTASEKVILEKLRNLIEYHYQKHAGKEISEIDYSKILQSIFVSIFDIESESSGELAVVTLLTGLTPSSAPLIWSSLIELCITLASKRQSIKSESLISKYKEYTLLKDQQSSAIYDLLSLDLKGSVSSGREVVIVESPFEDADILLIEFYRFDSLGNSRIKFSDGRVRLQNGTEYKLLYRGSTFTGAERFMAENSEKFQQKSLAIIPINGNGSEYDKSPFALLRAEKCQSLLRSKDKLLECIYCGEAIFTNRSPWVEIDEVGAPAEVGLVHKECLQPTYRVLGIIEHELMKEKPHLHNFNFSLWYQKIALGSNIFLATAHLSNVIRRVFWNPNYSNLTNGNWCVRVDLEDGSAQYVTERKKVQRYSESEAAEVAEKLNEGYRAGRRIKDPWCYGAENRGYGTYSGFVKLGALKGITKCVSATVVKYTRSIGETYSLESEYYAPIVYFSNRLSKEPIFIKDVLFLVSNPLEIKNYLDNWKEAGIEFEDFSVDLIESDTKFDELVRKSFRQDFKIIVDPFLMPDGEMVGGAIIDNLEDHQ